MFKERMSFALQVLQAVHVYASQDFLALEESVVYVELGFTSRTVETMFAHSVQMGQHLHLVANYWNTVHVWKVIHVQG